MLYIYYRVSITKGTPARGPVLSDVTMQSLGRGLRSPSPTQGMSSDRSDVDRTAVSGRDTDRHARGDVSRSGKASHARYAMDGSCGIVGTGDVGARTSGVTVVAWGWSLRMKRSKENVLALASEMGSIVTVNGGWESMSFTRSISLFPYREIPSGEGFT